MSLQRRWLPREGFTADSLQALLKKTALNPALTLPFFLLAQYTRKGQDLSLGHETASGRLKLLVYLGLARWINGMLNRGVLDNWQGDQYDWSKEVVLITGGSEGIGKNIVLLLAAKNIKVIVLDIQPLTYEAPNANVHFYHCDITSASSVSDVANTIRSSLAHPTILINNAGIAAAMTILDSTEASIQKTFNVNILAHFRLVKEFLPHMVSQNHGMVVTVASMSGYIVAPQLVDYACTKAAAIAFHEGLAVELKTRYNAPKVRTVCVNPSWAQTRLSAGFKNESTFLAPTVKAEAVAEAVVEKIMQGTSGMVVLPRVLDLFATYARGWPLWMQVGLRNGLKDNVFGIVGKSAAQEQGGESNTEGSKEGEGNLQSENMKG